MSNEANLHSPANGYAYAVWKIMLASGLLGALCFIAIYGVKILNPAYDDWLFAGGDLTQHYTGWLFFRRSDWHMPFGLIDGLLGEISFSLMYTDSIPLFALFFKLLSPILPETFQYFGIWGLFCFVLNGSFASLLIHKFNKNPIFCVLGSSIFILCPAIFHRMYGQEALAGHYVIILGLVLWAYQNHAWKIKWMKLGMPAILWGCTGILAVYTHMYFLPLVYCSMLAAMITDIFHYKKIVRPICCFVSLTVCSLLALAGIGAFYGNGSSAAYGLGYVSANLNTFWNGMPLGGDGIFVGYPSYGSSFLKEIPYGPGQYEGFAYLGLGVLLAVVLSLLILFRYFDKQAGGFSTSLKLAVLRYKWYIIAFAATFIISLFFAVSPICMFNDKVLYSIDYPDKIVEILGIFRASGRFAWFADYLIFTAVLFAFSKIDGKRIMILTLSVCICIQLADLKDLISSRKWYKETQTYTSPLVDPRWDELADGCDKLVILPYDVPGNLCYTFGIFAYKHNMTVSHFHVARPPLDDIINQYYKNIDLIAQGNGDPDALYVFLDSAYIPEGAENIEIYEMDGFYVARCNRS